MKRYILTFLVFIGIVCIAEAGKRIAPNNKKIVYKGAMFVEKSKQRAVLSRHSTQVLAHKGTMMNPSRANTQSGVSVLFNTNSNNIKVGFEKREGADQRQLVFAIFKNGKFDKTVRSLEFQLEGNDASTYTEWEIVLPTFYGMNFLGLEIDTDAKLKVKKKKKRAVYIAIGNSITHGTGQKGHAWETYPFLLAREKNWDLYNLAVGGSKISWPVAAMTKQTKAKVITILWGYNDWNSPLDLERDIIPNYEKLLVELRKVQPKAKIYCILPTTSKKTVPNKGDDSLDDIRNAERAIAQNLQHAGDSKLFILEGQMMTTEDDLNDVVHFSEEGASRFSQKLDQVVNLP